MKVVCIHYIKLQSHTSIFFLAGQQEKKQALVMYNNFPQLLSTLQAAILVDMLVCL